MLVPESRFRQHPPTLPPFFKYICSLFFFCICFHKDLLQSLMSPTWGGFEIFLCMGMYLNRKYHLKELTLKGYTHPGLMAVTVPPHISQISQELSTWLFPISSLLTCSNIQYNMASSPPNHPTESVVLRNQ